MDEFQDYKFTPMPIRGKKLTSSRWVTLSRRLPGWQWFTSH